MLKTLALLQKNLVIAIPVAMILGLLGGGFLFDAKPLKALIIPVTFVMIYPMMTPLNVRSVFSARDTKLQLVTQLINFVLVPMIVFTIGKLFLDGEAAKFRLWAVGLFLIGVLPASGMTISWTGFANGNKEAATKMLVFGVVMRDLSIALAIAMTAFGKEGSTIALLIAIAYIFQIQSAAWYIKLVPWIFGREKQPATLMEAEATN